MPGRYSPGVNRPRRDLTADLNMAPKLRINEDTNLCPHMSSWSAQGQIQFIFIHAILVRAFIVVVVVRPIIIIIIIIIIIKFQREKVQ
jgi:hypothetical protein